MKKILTALLCIGFFCLACAPVRFQERRLALSRNLSIPVAIILYAKQRPDWDKIYTRLNELAELFDYRNPANSIWKLNHSYRADPEAEVLDVIKQALAIAEFSRGAFDPTILPLTSLWNFEDEQLILGADAWQPPAAEAIREARLKVDYHRVLIDTAGTILIPEGFGLDLGGIAKGGIVDLLADYLNSLGYSIFLIEAGGDLLLSGLKPVPGDSVPWLVAVNHPRNKGSELIRFQLGQAGKRISIVTSGDYERFVIKDGVRYHHLIDPATGYPAGENISVTVIAPTCLAADALSTAAFVLGFEEGRVLLKGLPEVEGLLIRETPDGLEAAATSGFPVSADNVIPVLHSMEN